MQAFHYLKPRTVDEAIRAVADNPEAAVVAGGTDVVTLIRDGIRTPTHVVDINRLPLDGVEWLPRGGVRIGSLCRNAIDDRELSRRYPALVEALRSGASPQIRNRATFGGNLMQRVRCPYYRMPEYACNRRQPGTGCASIEGDSHHQAVFGTSPACIAVHPSDCAVALVALDATVHVQGPGGPRSIPAEDFHRLPEGSPDQEHALNRDELILAVELPSRPFSTRSHYLKFRDRASFAFAVVSVAVAVELRGGVVRSARVALGGVAPKPWRSHLAERALVGNRLDATTIAAAGEAATTGATPQRHNGYKVDLVRRAVRQALTTVGGR